VPPAQFVEVGGGGTGVDGGTDVDVDVVVRDDG
jgi:hypothetical protein